MSGGLEAIRSVEGIATEVWKRHTGIYLRHGGGALILSLAIDVDGRNGLGDCVRQDDRRLANSVSPRFSRKTSYGRWKRKSAALYSSPTRRASTKILVQK